MTTPNFLRPDLDLVIEERDGGLQITQHGKTYLARKWRLTPEVLTVIESAIAHGLTALWQDGHPGGPGSHHISFSFDHRRATWVFAIGSPSSPPAVKRVTFHKRLSPYFKHAGLGWNWAWETAGGKNIHVEPEDLNPVLDTLPLEDIRAGRMPTIGRSTRSAPGQFYRSESELEEELYNLIMGQDNPGLIVERQRRFRPNTRFEVASRPDILIVSDQFFSIIELKLHYAGETEVAQVQRYLSNDELRRASGGRRLHGVLIAERFGEDALVATTGRADISLMCYAQGADGALVICLTKGDDVITHHLGREAV